MPRRKKPDPDMTDRELFESLFPKPIRQRIERELEAEKDSEDPEETDEYRIVPSMDRKDK
jgi:hypothetical protein